MSLKRKFKAERAPLVSDTEVRKLKEKFGHTKQSKAIRVSSSVSRKPSSQPFVSAFPYMQCIKSLLATAWAASFFLPKDICIGEDSTSVEAHVAVLQSEFRKMRPDMTTVKDRMVRTFSWRRREIMEGMPVEDVLKKYPFLKMPSIVSTAKHLNVI